MPSITKSSTEFEALLGTYDIFADQLSESIAKDYVTHSLPAELKTVVQVTAQGFHGPQDYEFDIRNRPYNKTSMSRTDIFKHMLNLEKWLDAVPRSLSTTGLSGSINRLMTPKHKGPVFCISDLPKQEVMDWLVKHKVGNRDFQIFQWHAEPCIKFRADSKATLFKLKFAETV